MISRKVWELPIYINIHLNIILIMNHKRIKDIENPYWKERSGIGQLFRDLRYSRYADPESVEGIHRNRERYAPVLEKYGVDEVETEYDEYGVRRIVGKQAGGLIMNYGDYGRSYT